MTWFFLFSARSKVLSWCAGKTYLKCSRHPLELPICSCYQGSDSLSKNISVSHCRAFITDRIRNSQVPSKMMWPLQQEWAEHILEWNTNKQEWRERKVFAVLEQEKQQGLGNKPSLLTSRHSSKGNAFVYIHVMRWEVFKIVSPPLSSWLAEPFLSGCGFNCSLQSQMRSSSL